MYIIKRIISGREEYWSTDLSNTHKYWMGASTPTYQGLFDPKYIVRFFTPTEGYIELEKKIKPAYLKNENIVYSVEKEKEVSMSDHKLYVICRSMKRNGVKEYYKKNRSSAYWEPKKDGEFTRKFASLKAANEVMQNILTRSIRTEYDFYVEPFDV